LTKSEVPRTVWVTDLADFLVVRDILGDPGPFLHYAKARSDPSRPAPYMETDALVSYLEDRLTASPESAVSAGPPALLLHYNSGLINDYYTKLELGYPAERLGLGIPMRSERRSGSPGLRTTRFCGGRLPPLSSR